MPRKLFHTMEENLNPATLLHMTVWLSTVVDEGMNPHLIHGAITNLEERIYKGGCDPEFTELYDFFVSLRPPVKTSAYDELKKLFLLAMLRFSLLGLHAFYGDIMVESPTLKKLRASRLCNSDVLWESALSVAPRIRDNGFSFLRAVEARRQDAKAERQTSLLDDAALLDAISALARQALPPVEIRQEHFGPNAGWYVVANWMDFCVNVNDSPRTTYDGARELDTLPNGALVYVLSAPGYRGLHVSSDVWGKILWQGKIAWVPMNLLIQLNG